MKVLTAFLLGCVLALSAAFPTEAHDSSPGDAFETAAFEARLNAQVPLHLAFRDESGRRVALGDYFGRRPVLLILAYYECPNLCPLALDGLAANLRAVAFDAGDQFEVVAVSINPDDDAATAAAKKVELVRRYAHPGAEAGWHLLTGEHAPIDSLAEAVGFRYAYDAAQQQYAHPTGVMILTPQGKISRYLFGIEFAARDLRLGLVEASEGRIASAADALLLRCYDYDPTAGRYSLVVMKVVRLAGMATALLLLTFTLGMAWRER